MKTSRVWLSIPILGALLSCSVQPSILAEEADAFSKVFSRQQYLEDLDELARTLAETHPQPYAFTSEKAFWAVVEEKKSLIGDSTPFREFLWHCSEIIARLGCGHTSLGYFIQEDKILPPALRFPVEARLIDSRLIVLDPLVNEAVLSAGEVILSINGTSASEIRAGIYRHIPSDGYSEGFPKQLLNGFFTAYVSYYFNFPSSYQIEVEGRPEPVGLAPLAEHSHQPRIAGDRCPSKLCLDTDKEKKLARMTVRSFAYYGEKLDVFKDFVDDSFREIRDSQVDNLIIDLRFNGGGASFAGSYLLQHIASKPFTYFAEGSAGAEAQKQEVAPSEQRFLGKIFILMDGDALSTTGHFLSLVKHHGFATLVGEESGATYTCNDNSQRFRLTHTGVSYKVARNTFFTTALGLPKNRGVEPDHEVQRSLEDFLGTTDSVMSYAESLIGARDASGEPSAEPD